LQPLIINKKTGFKNLEPFRPVVIRDFRGMMFYSTEGLKPVNEFNLPAGTYFIEAGNIVPLKRPVHYRLIILPLSTRNLKPPFDFTVLFATNPNKCSINWKAETITFDNDLRSKTLPELYFILFHEFAHSRYNSEKNADLLATNLMKIKGFNPSQIGAAPITSLSEIQMKRKNNVVSNIIRYV
jgi:hypothetical protein